jgi:hypothetical protein
VSNETLLFDAIVRDNGGSTERSWRVDAGRLLLFQYDPANSSASRRHWRSGPGPEALWFEGDGGAGVSFYVMRAIGRNSFRDSAVPRVWSLSRDHTGATDGCGGPASRLAGTSSIGVPWVCLACVPGGDD